MTKLGKVILARSNWPLEPRIITVITLYLKLDFLWQKYSAVVDFLYFKFSIKALIKIKCYAMNCYVKNRHIAGNRVQLTSFFYRAARYLDKKSTKSYNGAPCLTDDLNFSGKIGWFILEFQVHSK